MNELWGTLLILSVFVGLPCIVSTLLFRDKNPKSMKKSGLQKVGLCGSEVYIPPTGPVPELLDLRTQEQSSSSPVGQTASKDAPDKLAKLSKRMRELELAERQQQSFWQRHGGTILVLAIIYWVPISLIVALLNRTLGIIVGLTTSRRRCDSLGNNDACVFLDRHICNSWSEHFIGPSF